MNWYFYIGLIAAVCVAIFSMPQLIRVLKTKDTSSIPLGMYVLLFIGDFCFVLDGIGMLADSTMITATKISSGLPILLANLIAGSIAGTILGLKLRAIYYSKKFGVSEKQFCENYETYRSKIKMNKAEKKAQKAKTEIEGKKESKPTEPTIPEEPTIIG